MRLVLSRTTVALTTAAIALSSTIAAAPAAATNHLRNYCGSEAVEDGAVRIRGCLQTHQTDARQKPLIKPWAKMRFASSDPTKWQSCAVVVALFIDGQKRTDRVHNCLTFARAGNSASPELATFSGWWITGEPYTQYQGVVRWYGYYNNVQVGSHINARSTTVSFGMIGFGNSTLDGINYAPAVNGVLADPASPEELEQVGWEPAIPVEVGL